MSQIKTFFWRVWNTAKYPLGVIAMAVVTKLVLDIVNANTTSILFTPGYIDGLAVEVAKAIGYLLGISTLAGAEKVIRDYNES